EERARELWAATYLLLGLRYAPEMADVLLQGVVTMEESTTYQAILARGRDQGRAEGLAEGRAEGLVLGARRALLHLGQRNLGPVDKATRDALEAINDVQDLDQLLDRLNEVSSWSELLGGTRPRRRNGRRQR